jgi:hypothetical protein
MNQRQPHENITICTPKLPARKKWLEVARQAQALRKDNVPDGLDLEALASNPVERGRLMLNIRLRWPKSGVDLSVGFLDGPSGELRAKILAHMNMWNKTANVSFRETGNAEEADVRIARTHGGETGGNWSWLGVDIRNHPGEPTMNLDGFTMSKPDSEFRRVVCHEAGHTLGFPHEHLRGEFISNLDRDRTIAHFTETQGWSEEDVVFQLLTPLVQTDHDGTPVADPHSIMCYEIPGSCTINGQPIVGGTEINAVDFAFAGRVYPKTGSPA